jgi:hypothetical protein
MEPKTGFESGTSPTISENGAPIHTGRGLEDAKRRIVEAFERVRNNSATPSPVTPVTPATPQAYTEHQEHRFQKHVETLTQVALISVHTSARRCHVHEIVVPQETAEELFTQLLNRPGRNPGG